MGGEGRIVFNHFSILSVFLLWFGLVFNWSLWGSGVEVLTCRISYKQVDNLLSGFQIQKENLTLKGR